MGTAAVFLALSSIVATILFTQGAPVTEYLGSPSASAVNRNRDRHDVEEMERFYRTYDNGTVEFKIVLSNGHVQYQRISSKIVDGSKIQVYEGYVSERYMDGRYGTRYYAADENGYRSSPVQVENTPPILPSSGPYAVIRQETDQSHQSGVSEESIPTVIRAEENDVLAIEIPTSDLEQSVLEESKEQVVPKIEENDKVNIHEENFSNINANLDNTEKPLDLPKPQHAEENSTEDHFLSTEQSTEQSSTEGSFIFGETSSEPSTTEQNVNLEESSTETLAVVQEVLNFAEAGTKTPAEYEASTDHSVVDEKPDFNEANTEFPTTDISSTFVGRQFDNDGLTDSFSNPSTETSNDESKVPEKDPELSIVQNTEAVDDILSVTEHATSGTEEEDSNDQSLLLANSEHSSSEDKQVASSTEAVLKPEDEIKASEEEKLSTNGNSFGTGILESVTEVKDEVNTDGDTSSVSRYPQNSVSSESTATVEVPSKEEEKLTEKPAVEENSTQTITSENENETKFLIEDELASTSTATVTEYSTELASVEAATGGVLADEHDISSDVFINSITTVPNSVTYKDARSLGTSTESVIPENSLATSTKKESSATELVENKIFETTEEVIVSTNAEQLKDSSSTEIIDNEIQETTEEVNASTSAEQLEDSSSTEIIEKKTPEATDEVNASTSTELIPSSSSTIIPETSTESLSTLENIGNKIVETFEDLFSFMSSNKKPEETEPTNKSENKTEVNTSTEAIKDLGISSTESITAESDLKTEKDARHLDISTELPSSSDDSTNIEEGSGQDHLIESNSSETSSESPSSIKFEEKSGETKEEEMKTESIVPETSTDLVQSVSAEEVSSESESKAEQPEVSTEVNDSKAQEVTTEAEILSTTLESSEDEEKTHGIEIEFSPPVVHF